MSRVHGLDSRSARSATVLTRVGVLVIAAMAGGCAASITSTPFVNSTVNDGVVYKLPVREFAVDVVYELVKCEPSIEIEVVDLVVSSSLVPSEDVDDWYEIDVTTLNQIFSSVDPATIELNNGMLTTVGLKTTGAAAQVITLAKEVLEGLALDFQLEQQCTEGAKTALTAGNKKATVVTERIAAADEAERAMLANATQDAERKVKVARERAAEATNQFVRFRDSMLRKKIVYRLRPGTAYNCAWVPSQSNDLDAFCDWPVGQEVGDWFAGVGPLGGELPQELKNVLRAAMRVDPVQLSEQTKGSAPAERFAGVYYRRPVSAVVVIQVPTGKAGRVFRVVDATQSIPQLGSLHRIELKGTALGSRNVSVSFDESGQIKKYEMTSKGIAEAMTAATKEVESVFAKPAKPSELEALTAEVALLTKKKELIDAKAALEAAEAMDVKP